MADPEPTGPERVASGVIGMYEQLRALLHPAELARHAAHTDARLEAVESDLADFVRPFLDGIAEHPDTDPRFADALRTIIAPAHQSQLVIVAAAAYAMIRQLVDAALIPYTTSVQNRAFAGDPTVPLSPAEAALAVVKGKMDYARAATESTLSGIDGDRFDWLYRITGEPIAIQEALLLYRRGQIDDAKLFQIVAESRVRTDYIEQIKDLRYAPPTAGEVVSGRLKAHLSEQDYLTKLSEAGIDPANSDWLLATAGRPYGTEQALDLLNRGEITEDRVRQVIAQSDVNPDYTDDILKLRVYLPPPRSVVPLVRSGALSAEDGLALLEMHGVPEKYAQAFIQEATTTKTSAAKELSMAQVLKLYENRYITKDEATVRLAKLNYPTDEIALLLQTADDARHLAYVDAVIARVHARYVAYKLTEPEVHSTLSADGVPPAAIADYLTLWNLERGANYHALTPAAIVGAYRREEIGPDETRARLLGAGVQPADLAIVLADGWPPTKPPSQAIIDAVVFPGVPLPGVQISGP